MDTQNYTSFDRNLAIMAIYLHMKFELNWTKRFELESENKNLNGQMNQKTDKQTDGITLIFKRNLAMMVIYLPVKFEFDRTKCFELESGSENVDAQTNDLEMDKLDVAS